MISVWYTVSLLSTVTALPPIDTVAVGQHREVRVNGEPFLPLMIWLQDPENFPKAVDVGCNTTAGYWPTSGGTADVVAYQKLVAAAGLYGVMPFDARLRGDRSLLAYIHDDEPDLSHQESDAKVVPGEGLRVNNSTPLWKIVDGELSTWSVLDPLAGAKLTVQLAAPVTVTKLAAHLTVSAGLPVARRVRFSGDGRELATATFEAKRGRQEVPLPQPATFRELLVEVLEVTPGEQVYGSIGEVEGFDATGRNVLLSPPRRVPRAQPEAVLASYQEARAADPTRPLFLTLTAHYMPVFSHYSAAQREALYPAYVAAADVLGFDIYPIYGWGRPDWIDRVYDGTVQLRALAGNKPLYAWIETSKGSQWVSAANQKDVTPQHLRAEVWMAVVGGATAIGYFTHIWKPAYAQFGVPPENVAALRQINAQLTRLAPAILAAPLTPEPTIAVTGNLRAAVGGRRLGDEVYLFAVNLDAKAQAGTATVQVPGLAAGTKIEVIDEDRSLTAVAGGFSDAFDGLAVHLYRYRAAP